MGASLKGDKASPPPKRKQAVQIGVVLMQGLLFWLFKGDTDRAPSKVIYIYI